MDTIGQRIKIARQRTKLTQASLAKTLGVTPGAVAQWETDRTTPDNNRISEVADAIGISSDWLLKGGPFESASAHKLTELPAQGMQARLAEIHEKVRQFEFELVAARNVESLISPAESIIRGVVSRMPGFKLEAYPHMGIAAADEQDGREWDAGQTEPGVFTKADAEEPRVITVRGKSAEELARDGQQCVIDIAHINVATGDLCVVLTKDKSLRLKRKDKDRGKLRVYKSINRDYPDFEVPPREVIAEFPVVTILVKTQKTSPVETLPEPPPAP
jgi:transcriptional regulator with XRE-family HTH domain